MQRELIRNTYPDEYIEQWGNIYLANPALRRCGILFGMFLAAPVEILDACLSTNAPESAEHLPLLPRQQKVAARIFEGFPSNRIGQQRSN